jgi:hypothetical protein
MRWHQRLFQRAPEKRLDAALRSHLEQQIAAYVAVGMTLEEARRRGKLELLVAGLGEINAHSL